MNPAQRRRPQTASRRVGRGDRLDRFDHIGGEELAHFLGGPSVVEHLQEQSQRLLRASARILRHIHVASGGVVSGRPVMRPKTSRKRSSTVAAGANGVLRRSTASGGVSGTAEAVAVGWRFEDRGRPDERIGSETVRRLHGAPLLSEDLLACIGPCLQFRRIGVPIGSTAFGPDGCSLVVRLGSTSAGRFPESREQ